MIQANFTVSPTSGYVLATQYTVTNLTTSVNTIRRYNWDPGTGAIVYDKKSPTFTYKYPGSYVVTLTAIDFNGNTSTATQYITAVRAYNDYLTFTDIPDRYADPGLSTETPFEISVVSSNIDSPLVVDLHVANSLSTPKQFVLDKWGFLTPTWYFTDTNFNTINSLNIEPVPVYINDVVVAVSGTGKFYYIDSMSTGNPTKNCPLLITATLQTSGFNYPYSSINNQEYLDVYTYPSHANNETVCAGLIWQVNDLVPTNLKITGNYINDIYPEQYVGVKIPTLITYHCNKTNLLSGSPDTYSNILFSYPPTNDIGKYYTLDLFLSGLSGNNLTWGKLDPSYYTVEQTPLYVQNTDINNAKIGGYAFTSITPLSAIPLVSIGASTTIFSTNNSSEVFPFPLGYTPAGSVWISNPEQNYLNKITLSPYPSSCDTINYFKDKKALIDGYRKEVKVPPITGTSTFNYYMSGFSGIYGIAIDPIDYSIVTTDSEADRLYRFTNTGVLTAEYDFKYFDITKENQTTFLSNSFIINTPLLKDDRYPLDNIIDPSLDVTNYIVELNGLVQPGDTYSISFDGYFQFTVDDPTPNPDSTLRVTAIYNTALPPGYQQSTQIWEFVTVEDQQEFYLTGAPPEISQNTSNYIITVDGVIQSPYIYEIQSRNSLVVFNEIVPINSFVRVVYLPLIINAYTWVRNFSTPTKVISLANENPFLIFDPWSTFFITVGGVYQGDLSYKVDAINKTLTFETYLPVNTDIFITYSTTTDVVDQPFVYTPAGISLDSFSNMWVSLFNRVLVLKFDRNFNLLFKTDPSSLLNMNALAIDKVADRLDGDYLLKPPTVETDRDNNSWATYAHPLCSILVKYDSNGEPLTVIKLPQYSVPTSLAIDGGNNVWVSNTYTVLSTPGNIHQYRGDNYELVRTIENIPKPGELCFSRGEDLWFTHSIRGVGCFQNYNAGGNLYLWYNNVSGTNINLTETNTYNSYVSTYTNDEDFSGLAVDVYDRVWYIDSTYNYVNVLQSGDPTKFNSNTQRKIKITPKNTIGYYVDPNTFQTFTVDFSADYKSAQAIGDWTGNKWYQKYAKFERITVSPVSAASTTFSVSAFENPNQIRRINETFDTAGYYKALALPDNLNSNTVLFDQFFAAAVGTGALSANEDIGQVTYERIANFVQNHSDVDSCLTDQLLNLAELTDLNPSVYATLYPVEIKNMLDIASTPKNKLWGIPDEVPLMPQSIGNKYDTFHDYVTAGTKIVLKNKFDSSTTITEVPKLGSLTAYPLSSFEGLGFIQPVTINYFFYDFEPIYTGNYISNIIDWKSEQTTLTPSASTFEEWYGDNGIIENTFKYLLTKNLFLK